MEARPSLNDVDVKLIANGPDAVIVVTRDGRIVHANSVAENISGFSRDQLVTHKFIEFLHPQDQTQMVLLYQLRLEVSPVSSAFETRVITKQGYIVPVSASRDTTLWKNQPADVITFRDVTDRKKLEKIVHNQLQILDMLNQCLIITDRDLFFVYASAPSLKLFNLARDRLNYHNINEFDLFDISLLPEIEKTVLIEGKTWQREISHRFDDSRELLAWITMSPVLDETARIIGSIIVILEIKKPRSLGSQIKERRDMLDSLIEGVATDPNGIITYVSDQNSRRTGWRKEDRLGHSIFEFFPPDFQEKAREILESVLGRRNYSGELPVICPDGSIKHFMVHLKPVVSDEGRVTSIVGVTADLKENADQKPETLSGIISKALVPVIGQQPGGLEIYCLGALKVCSGERQIQRWPGKRVRMVFECLVNTPKVPVARDILLEAIWPEHAPDLTVNSLRMAVHGLRRTLNDLLGLNKDLPSVLFRDGCYLFSPELNMTVDFENFEENISSGRRLERGRRIDEAIQLYQRAEELYRGDFLEGENYLDWVLSRREAIKDSYLLVLDKLAEYYSDQRDYESCILYCRKTIAIDPSREDVYRRLMCCFSRLGQRNRAMRWFRTCRQSIAIDLDTSLDTKTTDLYLRLLDNEEI
jgi:PAS domain S-box-containing protein